MTDITPSIADAATAALLHARTAKEYASTAVDAAEESATVAEDTVHNLIYGILPADPPLRPDGSPCQNGDQYYNETSAVLRMRVSGAWTTIAMSVSAGVLVAAQNLNDVSSKEQSRINLGLGDAATKTAGAVNGVASLDSSGKVPTAQLPAAGGVYLSAGANLSDIPDDAAARTNIGLGTAATKMSGAVNGVADLDSGGKVPVAQLPAGTASGVASLDTNARVPKTQLWAGISNGMAELDSGGKVPVAQLPAFGNPVTVTKSADYTTIGGDSGKVIFVTTGASDKSITFVGANTAGDGATMIVQKADSGAGKVIVKDSDGTTQISWLSTQFDVVCFRSNGSTWSRYWHLIMPRIETFIASGTYTKPPLAASVHVVLRGPGGGGGSGRQSGATMFGGCGGGGGAFVDKLFRAAEIASTESVTVPAGGNGGTGVSGANGNAGADASPTLFGSVTKLHAGGGKGGAGGGVAVATGADGGGVWGVVATINTDATGFAGGGGANSAGADGNNGVYGGGASGASNSAGTAGNGGGSAHGGGAGGSGGGLGTSTGRAPSAGGRSGAYSAAGGGAAGTSGTSPSAGTDGVSIGTGGGGGGCNTASGTGGGGGAGGPGGGGGGGGAASIGSSGAGGAGGRGEAVISTIF